MTVAAPAKHRVVILSNGSRRLHGWSEAHDILRAGGAEVVDPGESLPEGSALLALAAEADGLFIGTNPIPDQVFEASPRLRVIGKPGIGVDNVNLEAATRHGVAVCNTPGSNAEAVADHTFGLLLAVTRRIPALDRLTRTGGGWHPWPLVIGAELPGMVLGIIGLGNIGRAVARRAKGFSMRLLGHDVVPSPEAAGLGVEQVTLERLLRESDVVSVHVPLAPATRGLLNAERLALMKPGAFLVNTARGGVVDETALAEALRAGRLAGAGVDVFEQEPARSSPLFELDNVVLTPHVAGFSPQSSARARVMTATNIVQVLRGERPASIVNRDVLDSPRVRGTTRVGA